MTAKQIKKLQDDYNKAVNSYTEVFCKKHDFQFDYWVADKVGEIGSFSDFYFAFNEVKYDIDTKQPKGKIIEWYDYNVDYNMDIKNTKEYITINYSSYCKGMRRKE